MVNQTELRQQITTARSDVQQKRQQLQKAAQAITQFKKQTQKKPSQRVLRGQRLQDKFARQKQRISALAAAKVASKSIKAEEVALKTTEKDIRRVESSLDAFERAQAKALQRAKKRQELFRQIAVTEGLRGRGGGTVLKPKQFRELKELSKSLDLATRARALRSLRGVADVKGSSSELEKLSKDFPKLFVKGEDILKDPSKLQSFPLQSFPKIPTLKDTTLKEQIKFKGPTTFLLEESGRIGERKVKKLQERIKLIKGAIKVIAPSLSEKKIPKFLLKETPEEISLAQRDIGKFVGQTAPFFAGGPGLVLATTTAAESFVTPEGKKRIEQSKDFLKEKNLPESLAYVPPAALGVGGAFGFRAHSRTLTNIGKISKESEIVKTSVLSPNVRDKQINKIIRSLDPDVQLKLTANKLTAGRVYQTNIGEGINRRTITFLEFGKGIKAEKGIESGRRLFGVELDKKGNVVRQIGGFSIEKTNLEGTTRAITSLVIRSKQKRRILGTKERNEFIQFTELSKSKVTKAAGVTKADIKTGVTIVTRKEIGKPRAKIDPSELVPSPEEARKVRAFFAGEAAGAGKPFAQVTTKALSVPKDAVIKVKPSKGIITTDIKSLEVGESIAVKPITLSVEKIKGSVKTTGRLVEFRKKLSPKALGEFDKLTKIERLFLEGQVRTRKINPKAGLSIKEVKRKLTVKLEKPVTGGQVVLKSPAQVTKAKVTPTVAPSQFAGKGLAPSAIPSAVGLLPPSATRVQSALAIQIAKGLSPAFKTAGALAQDLGPRLKLASASKAAQISRLDTKQSSLLASSQNVALEISTAQAPALRQQLTVAQALAQRARLNTRVKQRLQSTRAVPKIPAIAPTPFPLLIKAGEKPTGKFRKDTGIGYIPEVKERGKWIPLSLPLKTEFQARNLARSVTDNTTSRRQRVREVKKVKNFGKRFAPSVSPRKFRDFRIVRGKKVPLKGRVEIERVGHAIDTRGEVTGLKVAKFLKQRYGSVREKVKGKRKGAFGSRLKAPPKLKF